MLCVDAQWRGSQCWVSHGKDDQTGPDEVTQYSSLYSCSHQLSSWNHLTQHNMYMSNTLIKHTLNVDWNSIHLYFTG